MQSLVVVIDAMCSCARTPCDRPRGLPPLSRQVALFCDLHGHSRKLDVFMYGCEKKVPKDTLPAYPGWPVPGSAGGQTNIPYRCEGAGRKARSAGFKQRHGRGGGVTALRRVLRVYMHDSV